MLNRTIVLDETLKVKKLKQSKGLSLIHQISQVKNKLC